MKNEDFGPYEPAPWTNLSVGDAVEVSRPTSDTERALIGRRFTISRFIGQPTEYAVVRDEHGSWWVRPGSLSRT